MEDLPNEILDFILRFLPVRDIKLTEGVSRTFKSLVSKIFETEINVKKCVIRDIWRDIKNNLYDETMEIYSGFSLPLRDISRYKLCMELHTPPYKTKLFKCDFPICTDSRKFYHQRDSKVEKWFMLDEKEVQKITELKNSKYVYNGKFSPDLYPEYLHSDLLLIVLSPSHWKNDEQC